MPIIIPYLVLIISIYLVIGPIIDKPQIEYLYALAFIMTGLIFYVPFVKFGLTPRFMGKTRNEIYSTATIISTLGHKMSHSMF